MNYVKELSEFLETVNFLPFHLFRCYAHSKQLGNSVNKTHSAVCECVCFRLDGGDDATENRMSCKNERLNRK